MFSDFLDSLESNYRFQQKRNVPTIINGINYGTKLSKILNNKKESTNSKQKTKSCEQTLETRVSKLDLKKVEFSYQIDSYALVALGVSAFKNNIKMKLHIKDTYHVFSRNEKLTSKLERDYIKAEQLPETELGRTFNFIEFRLCSSDSGTIRVLLAIDKDQNTEGISLAADWIILYHAIV